MTYKKTHTDIVVQNLEERAVSVFSYIVMFLLLISGILSTYALWGTSYEYVFFTILGFINLAFNGVKNYSIPKWLVIYLAYAYLSHILTMESLSDIIVVRLIRVYVFYKLFFDNFDLQTFVNLYRKVAIVCVLFFTYQYCYYLFTGDHIFGVILSLPLSRGSGDVPVELSFDVSRDSSFFAEPAHFVQFLLPLLIIELFYYKRTKYFQVVIISAVLLLLKSGTALIGIFATLLLYVCKIVKDGKGIKKYFSLLFLLVALSVTVSFYVGSEAGDLTSQRAEQVEDGTEGSYVTRIVRGYTVFYEFPLVYKLIGNDKENFLAQMNKKSFFSWAFASDKDFYYNGIQTILLYTGLVGLLFFYFFIKHMYVRSTYCGKCILVIWFTMSLFASNYFGFSWVICFLLANSMRKFN